MRKYNAQISKQGSKRFNSIVKTINIADLGIIYLWLVVFIQFLRDFFYHKTLLHSLPLRGINLITKRRLASGYSSSVHV